MATTRKAKRSKRTTKTRKKTAKPAARKKRPVRAAKSRAKQPAKKPVKKPVKKPAKRPSARRATLRKTVARARAKPAAAPPRPAPARPAGSPQGAPREQRVGTVTHYFNHLAVAIIKLESGTLRVGDSIRIRGHTTDFTQKVESLEVDHAPATEVGPNDDFGLKVVDHARENDVVYKVRP